MRWPFSQIIMLAAFLLLGTILGWVPMDAQAHAGHQSGAHPAITQSNALKIVVVPLAAKPADQGPASLSHEPGRAWKGLLHSDWGASAALVRAALDRLESPSPTSRENACIGGCCAGMGCCVSAVLQSGLSVDQVPSRSLLPVGSRQLAPDALPNPVLEPPRSFV